MFTHLAVCVLASFLYQERFTFSSDSSRGLVPFGLRLRFFRKVGLCGDIHEGRNHVNIRYRPFPFFYGERIARTQARYLRLGHCMRRTLKNYRYLRSRLTLSPHAASARSPLLTSFSRLLLLCASTRKKTTARVCHRVINIWRIIVGFQIVGPLISVVSSAVQFFTSAS